MRSFVAIDLELTPSSGDHPRIIEVAAARFVDGAALATFSSLVNPECRLDPRIGELTGIRPADLTAAPPIAQAAAALESFIGDDPIVGQSVHFDLEALERSGVRLPNPTYDTFELASILLPGLPSYDLATIGRALGVEPESEHRALGDALVAGRVFVALEEWAGGLSLDVLTQVNALASHLADWPLAQVFAEALRSRLRNHFTSQRGVAPAQTAAIGGSQPASPLPPGGGPTGGAPASRPPTVAGGQAPSLKPGGTAGALAADPTDAAELPFLARPTTPKSEPIRPTDRPVPVDPEELAAIMRADGPIASALAGFEERPEQLRMMGAVARAFSEGGHLLVEAGTGTGKSLAYLLPSIYYAVRNGRRVVISTNTINLQDQLFHKDIPALQRCLPLRFKASLLKGRANYLCLRRWQVLSRSPNLSSEESLLLIKTLVWLATTETGDRAEMNLSTTDAALWSKVAAQLDSCALNRCPHFRRGACFVLRARKEAETSHLIVVNHALLLSDLATSRVLPDYSHVVIDEAHHLEEEATEQLGFRVTRADVTAFLSSLYQIAPGYRPTGFLVEIRAAVAAAGVPRDASSGLFSAAEAAAGMVDSLHAAVRSFFDTLCCFLHDHADDRRGSEHKLRLTRSARIQPGWAEVEVRWSELSIRLKSLGHALRHLEDEVDRLEADAIPEKDGRLADLAGFRSFLDALLAHGEEIISTPGPNGIYWMAGGSAPDQLTLCSAPLHVGEVLNSLLFSCKDSVVLTSATLAAEGGFDYVRERLGLEDASELMLGSPFDYRRSTLLYVVHDIPEPGRPAYQRAVESAIADMVVAMQGRTLVLFTSHSQLRLTNGAVRPRLEERDILVLAHGLDGSRRKLLQAFKAARRAVLFGTSSFWEGIDVVGDALSCVIIVKLPFAVPTDPVFAARSESFDEPFRQYSVPQTILKFKQGFGRLIRSASDRGVVLILDSRLRSKFYGPAFLQSLPRCTTRVGPASNAVAAAREWLRG